MKNKLLLISILVASLSCSAFAAACGGNETSETPAPDEPSQTVEDEEYTLTFDSLGGSQVEAQTYKSYQYLYAPEDPVRNGFTFDGWYWDRDYSREFIFEGNTMIPSDLTIYAKWVEYYTLTFNTDGGSAVDDIIVQQGESASAPADPVWDGHVFEGWFADEAGTTPFNFSSVTSNATVYAAWRAEQTDISITFYRNSPVLEDDGYSVAATSTSNEGDAIDGSAAADFAEDINSSLGDGDVYVFSYWSLDREGRQPVGSVVPYAEGGELNLYAQWSVSAGYCVVTFTGGTEGQLTLYIGKNSAITSDQAALIEQYYGTAVTSFTTSDGTAFDITSAVERNLALSPAADIGNFEFEAYGNGYTLVRYSGSEDSVVIPSSYNGMPVTAIGDGAFTNWITSVTIPDSVTSVGANAFADTGLEIVEGGRYVTYVGPGAFSGCNVGVTSDGLRYLTDDYRVVLSYVSGGDITIPSSVVAIADGAFSGAADLESVTFARGCSITAIPAYAFSGCMSLASVDMSAITPLTVGESAFEGCTALAQINLPSTVRQLGARAFSGCTSLSQITAAGVGSIGAYAFENCGFTSLNLSALRFGVLAEGTFSGCTSLEDITLPQTLEEIGARAFENCAALTTVTVNASAGARLTSIGEGAFAGCTSLRSLILFAALNDGSVINFAGGASAFDDCANDLVIFVASGSPDYDVEDAWYNAEEDEMYDFKQIYSQSYPGLTFYEGDSSIPVISVPSRVIMYMQASEEITESTDVVGLLVANGLAATDDGEGDVVFSIDSVTYLNSTGSSVLAAAGDGLYDLTDLGVYQVVVRATDRFGNSNIEIVRICIVK